MAITFLIGKVEVTVDDPRVTWTCPFAAVDADGCADCYRIGGGIPDTRVGVACERDTRIR